MTEYPQIHPHSLELKDLKDKANIMYKDMMEAENISRGEYRMAMEHLVKMGDSHKAFHERIQDLAKMIEVIEALAIKPFI